MQQRLFLKLDGVLGYSSNPRHLGAIELTGFYWGEDSPADSGLSSGKVLINTNLTVTKQSDPTSSILLLACAMKQNFAEGRLTIEELSETGSLIRSIILKLRLIWINSITANQTAETITLNFKRAKLLRPELKT